jgi:hypothetical protein
VTSRVAVCGPGFGLRLLSYTRLPIVAGAGGPVTIIAEGGSHLESASRQLQAAGVVVVGAGADLQIVGGDGCGRGTSGGGEGATALLFVASCHPCFE